MYNVIVAAAKVNYKEPSMDDLDYVSENDYLDDYDVYDDDPGEYQEWRDYDPDC